MKRKILAVAITMGLSGQVMAESNQAPSISELLGLKSGAPQAEQAVTEPQDAITSIQVPEVKAPVPKRVQSEEDLKKQAAQYLQGISFEREKAPSKNSNLPVKTTPKQESPTDSYQILNGGVIDVAPFETKIIKASQGMFNTIETGFKNAKIITANESTVKVVKGKLLISPNDKNPIGLVIHEKGLPEISYSVTLLPMDIPPTTTVFNLKKNAETQAIFDSFYMSQQVAAEQPDEADVALESFKFKNDPYTNNLLELLTTVAKADVPRGYSVAEANELRRCDGFDAHIKEILKGGSMEVKLAVVKNTSNKIINVDSMACYEKGMLAGAPYPRYKLYPGQETELYLVEKVTTGQKMAQKKTRKRLINE